MPVSSKEFLDIPVTVECGFTLTLVHDMIRIYSHTNLNAETARFSAVFINELYVLRVT